MNSTEPLKHGFRFRKRYVAAIVIVCLPLFCAIGVTGYFRLSSETRALRGSLMRLTPGAWDTKFAVHVGSLTMGLVRIGSSFFKLPPEPRAALDAVHGAEVGVYRLKQERLSVGSSAILASADKAMKARGWERVVGVAEGHELVAVYIPRKGVQATKMKCCLMVLQGRELVVASTRGNVEPLLQIARKRLDSTDRWHERSRTCEQAVACKTE
jgi:hypothetical protein